MKANLLSKMLRRFSQAVLIFLLFNFLFVGFFIDPQSWPTDAAQALKGPSLLHPFGFDGLGRDLFLRCLSSAQLTLLVGISSCVLSFVIGICIGATSAWRGGWFDDLLMRAVEILSSIPGILLMSILSVILFSLVGSGENSWFVLILAISLVSWMPCCRLARNLVIQHKTDIYLVAAQAVGNSPARIFYRHLLPNLSPYFLVMIGLQLPQFLMFESLLSFFGFGVQPPMATWGVLIQEGWRALSVYPQLVFGPASFLFLTVFSINTGFDFYREQNSFTV